MPEVNLGAQWSLHQTSGGPAADPCACNMLQPPWSSCRCSCQRASTTPSLSQPLQLPQQLPLARRLPPHSGASPPGLPLSQHRRPPPWSRRRLLSPLWPSHRCLQAASWSMPPHPALLHPLATSLTSSPMMTLLSHLPALQVSPGVLGWPSRRPASKLFLGLAAHVCNLELQVQMAGLSLTWTTAAVIKRHDTWTGPSLTVKMWNRVWMPADVLFVLFSGCW